MNDVVNQPQAPGKPAVTWPAWVLLALCLGITAFAWRAAQESTAAEARQRFNLRVERTQLAIRDRMKAYEQVLRGAAGLFEASDLVTRADWRRYFALLRLEVSYPGMQSVGFSPRVRAQDKARHIEFAREQGLADYTIRPKGERGQYVPVLYTEPYAGRNLRAPGYDMFSEPVRRAALERARDSGEASLTGKVTLVTETARDHQPGTLMFMPIYRRGAPAGSTEQRREALLGFIFSPFRMKDLMHGILGEKLPDIDVEIFDGGQPAPAHLLYDDDQQLHATLTDRQDALHDARKIDLNGRTWTLLFSSKPQFEAQMDYGRARLVLAGGVLLSGLLFALLRTMATREARAKQVAERLNAELIESEERFRHLAQHDSLTGLPNRWLLADHFELASARADRDQRRAALLYIDLDRFKHVNDSLGHKAGDDLLRTVAQRFQASVRKADTIARTGGDEFVVLLSDVQRAEDAALAAQHILTALAEPISVEHHELQVTPSIGISIYPDDGRDFATLLKNADAAMYAAKEQGRNSYQFFTAELNADAQRRLSIERELRQALAHNQFTLYYQPVFAMGESRLVGAEALIRWQHPQQGLIEPGAFIAIAEDSGLIVPIGEWVLREACRQAKAWQAAGSPLRIAVNISPRQFRQKTIMPFIERTLAGQQLDPRLLELEITESLLMHGDEATMQALTGLSALGIELTIDDFGTGYSSLSYLQRFSVDKLKIDASFVRDISSDTDDAAIVKAIIAMAHGLNLKVVAEGVETQEQYRFLLTRDCDQAQGHFFSAPLPAQQFERRYLALAETTQARFHPARSRS